MNKKTSIEEYKKALYKEKPTATIFFQCGASTWYDCTTSLGAVRFEVPHSEMGEMEFTTEMPAHLLIRWMKPEAL